MGHWGWGASHALVSFALRPVSLGSCRPFIDPSGFHPPLPVNCKASCAHPLLGWAFRPVLWGVVLSCLQYYSFMFFFGGGSWVWSNPVVRLFSLSKNCLCCFSGEVFGRAVAPVPLRSWGIFDCSSFCIICWSAGFGQSPGFVCSVKSYRFVFILLCALWCGRSPGELVFCKEF